MAILPKLIAIVGPTASGKTALSIALAKKYRGEIVSADSRQIYRDMNIGTAKPTIIQQNSIPHYLFDIKSPDEEYTVADYQRDAIAAIKNILHRGKLPFLVGAPASILMPFLKISIFPKQKPTLNFGRK